MLSKKSLIKPIKLGVMIALMVYELPAVATPVTLQNGYVKAGVSDYGTLGSNGSTSPGILFDKTGAGSYGINDFLTPGTPFEGYYITTASGESYSGNNTGDNGFGFSSPTALSSTSASWSGSNRVFSILNTYNLTTLGGQSVIAISTTLTNITTSSLLGIEFLRTLDPDPDVNAFGTYNTQNSVISSNQACGTGSFSGQTICIYSFDAIAHNAGVSSGWTTNPASYLAGLNDGNGDYAIGVAFNVGDLAAGQSLTLTYGYSLGATKEVAVGGGTTTTVPEPTSIMLVFLGISVIAASRKKQAIREC